MNKEQSKTTAFAHDKLFQQSEKLREQCIDLIWKYVKQEPDENLSYLFTKLVAQLRLLPLSTAVLDTFRGILGYDCWLSSEHPDKTVSFLPEVMHDVQECIANHNREWYSPRTSGYVQFYKPKE